MKMLKTGGLGSNFTGSYKKECNKKFLIIFKTYFHYLHHRFIDLSIKNKM